MKKIVAAALVLTFLFGGVAFAAPKKKAAADPVKKECTEQAKKEGVTKKKMKAYVNKCVAAKKGK